MMDASTRKAVLELADRIDAGVALRPQDAAAVCAVPGWAIVWRCHRAGYRFAMACAVGPAGGHVAAGGWLPARAACGELRRWGWADEARAWCARGVGL